MVAQNSLTSSGSQLANSLQQLSSGLRINTAADDAAGYAIVQGMTSQINGINQAAHNANDGVSLSQTASGALTEITNDLQTMRDLAVQSLNATNSASDRADLDAQFQQLKADINSVASQTQFNGVNLLDGSFQGATFQVGANAGQSITMSSISSAASNNLGQLYTSTAAAPAAYTSTGLASGTAVAKGDTGTFSITAGGQTYTTSQVTLTGNQATDLKTIAAAINQATGSTGGVVATVSSNGKGINLSSTTAQAFQVSYTAGTGSETAATFGLNSYNITGGFQATGTAVSATTYNALGIPAAGYTAAGAAPTGTDTTGDSATLTINGTAITLGYTGTVATDVNSAITAINAKTSTTGVTATLNANNGITLTSSSGTTPTINYANVTGTEAAAVLGLSTTFTSNALDNPTFTVKVGATNYTTSAVTLTGNQTTDLQNIAAAISAAAGAVGVTASVDSNGSIDLHSLTSQTVTVTMTNGTNHAGTETAASFGFTGAAGATPITATATPSSTVDTADVKTVDDANQVLTQVDAALQQLATTGAQLGAYQNRFQAAVTGLNTDSTNLTSARSQIQDTDYASATSALSKAQILQQASTAMVAQANTIPQNILTLLQKLP